MSNNLREFRIKKLMTQKELAEKSGVSQVTISFIENELSIPKENTKKKLCKVLRRPLRDVFPSDEAVLGSETKGEVAGCYGHI